MAFAGAVGAGWLGVHAWISTPTKTQINVRVVDMAVRSQAVEVMAGRNEDGLKRLNGQNNKLNRVNNKPNGLDMDIKYGSGSLVRPPTSISGGVAWGVFGDNGRGTVGALLGCTG
ncbi:MAG: hypothetical protein IPK13_03405 [Deltaproteobacteria bacterium]|nr:hypothetical protein [Deltaproteobacteria bacterium]